MGLGDATWAYLSSLEEEFYPKPFYQAVRSFYVASLKKVLPFGDSIKDLGVINPDQTCTYDFSVVEGLAKCFPQLGIADSESIDSGGSRGVHWVRTNPPLLAINWTGVRT